MTQLPPTYLSSTRAVLSPALAKTIERGVSPWPAPMTIASYDRSAAIVPSVGSFTSEFVPLPIVHPSGERPTRCASFAGTAPSPWGERAQRRTLCRQRDLDAEFPQPGRLHWLRASDLNSQRVNTVSAEGDSPSPLNPVASRGYRPPDAPAASAVTISSVVSNACARNLKLVRAAVYPSPHSG